MKSKANHLIGAFLCLFLNITLCQAQTQPDWLANPRGMDALDPSVVLPPFTPVVLGQTAAGLPRISVWGRNYYLTPLGLVQQVEIQGVNYFNKNMTLEIDINNSIAVFRNMSQQLVSKAAGKVVFLTQGTLMILQKGALAPQATFKVQTSIEYDGMVRVDLTITPQGTITLSGLDYKIFYPNEVKFARWDSALLPYNLSQSGTRNIPKETFYMTLPTTSGIAWQSPFKTGVWLGNEDRGFLWFCGSEQYWSPQPRTQRPGALTIERSVQDGVQLTVTPVSQSYIISQPVTYTFGFFATPVRPYTTGWRGWTNDIHLGKIISYDQTNWEEHPFYPVIKTGFINKLMDLITQASQQSKYLLSYIDPTIMTESFNLPEQAYYSQWVTLQGENRAPGAVLPPETWKYDNSIQYRVSAFSSWVDYYCYEMEMLAATGMIGSADIDEMEADYDANQIHGAGYVDQNGILENNYDIWGKRDLMKRLDYIFWKVTGKTPLIIAHGESMIGMPFMSFASVLLTGENSNTNYYYASSFVDQYSQEIYNQTQISLKLNPPGFDWYYYAYPLDRWQAEDTGTAFGIPVMVMTNLDKSPLIDATYSDSETAERDFMSMVNIHDNLIWPIFMANEKPTVVYQTWTARQNFGITDTGVKFYPYWEGTQIASTTQADIYISTYQNPNNKQWLLCISNLGLQDADFNVQLNQTLFSKQTIADLHYAINSQDGSQKVGQEIPAYDLSFPIHLAQRDFTMIILKMEAWPESGPKSPLPLDKKSL